ncbi:MAG: glycosyltransferase family 4 protein [Candidatus Accumulibacter sp.]|jgi:alpha-1,3-rhamnosyl/mannosyltransferase|nr:glycosyltransferase family 4 protein [Accumulibacter sp.]
MIAAQKIRAGINATALLSPRTGIGKYVFMLGREFLSSAEIDPSFFYAKHWSNALREESLPHVELIKACKKYIPCAYALSRIAMQARFSAGMRSRSLDIYHEPNYLAYRFNGPTVITVHDLSWIRHPETHPVDRIRAMNRYFPRSLERASAIITDCQFVRKELIEAFGAPPDRIFPVSLGVSPLFRPVSSERATPVLAESGLEFGKYFLSVGTIEPRKNLTTTLEAFSKLRPEIQKSHPLALVGMKGWLIGGIEAKIRPLLEKGVVKVLGYVPDQQMPALYSGATAFLFPSLYEGFGLPPLEAMACGTPVIVSDSSSIPEVVGDAGVLFDPRDVDGIAGAMTRALDDAAWRERLSGLGIERAAGFSWKRTADETIKVYRRVLST